MGNYVLVVLSNPTEAAEGEYNEWYSNTHVAQVLKTGGFRCAQRYRLATMDPPQEAAHRYLAIYEIDTDDVDGVWAAMRQAAANGSMTLSRALDVSTLSSLWFEELGDRQVG